MFSCSVRLEILALFLRAATLRCAVLIYFISLFFALWRGRDEHAKHAHSEYPKHTNEYKHDSNSPTSGTQNINMIPTRNA